MRRKRTIRLAVHSWTEFLEQTITRGEEHNPLGGDVSMPTQLDAIREVFRLLVSESFIFKYMTRTLQEREKYCFGVKAPASPFTKAKRE